MESSGNCERESRGNGDHTASADNSRNGDQSEVFYQWSQRTFFIKRRIWIPWLLLAQARLTATVFMLCFAMTDAQMRGNAAEVMTYMHEFYFESAAMILTLIISSVKLLEARSKGKTTDALKGLMGLGA